MSLRDNGASSGEACSGSPQEMRPAQGSFMSRIARFGIVCALAALTAGCFQPLYGDRVVGPNTVVNLRDALSAVGVPPIEAAKGSPEARLGVEVRNALLFNLTGGADTPLPTHQLKIALSSSRQQVIVDIGT